MPLSFPHGPRLPITDAGYGVDGYVNPASDDTGPVRRPFRSNTETYTNTQSERLVLRKRLGAPEILAATELGPGFFASTGVGVNGSFRIILGVGVILVLRRKPFDFICPGVIGFHGSDFDASPGWWK